MTGPQAASPDSWALRVDGVEVAARIDPGVLDDLLLPALDDATARRRHRRAVVFLVGPPGVGKSTLAAALVQRARTRPGRPLAVDAVGIDGFHLPQRHLDTHHLHTPDGPVPMSSVKGAPETYDVDALAAHLEASLERDVVWPVYDRRLHDVVPGTEPVTGDVLLVEGNWLLLDEPGWRTLARHADLVVFVDADPDVLRERLVRRKVRGGLDPSAAHAFYERSDRRNVTRVLRSSDLGEVHLALRADADGTIHEGDDR